MKGGIVNKTVMVLISLIAFILGRKSTEKSKKENKILAEKNKSQFILMDQWVRLMLNGGNLVNYLKEQGYLNIAIYGMSYTGENLLLALKDTEVQVCYGIDKRAGEIASDMDIFSLQDDLPEVDAVIVSEIYYFKDIRTKLSGKIKCPVISLEEVIYES